MAVRTVRCAGANEISGDAFSEIFSAAPSENPDIIQSNPQNSAGPFMDGLPFVRAVQVADHNGPLSGTGRVIIWRC
jgi:hypothetical protein